MWGFPRETTIPRITDLTGVDMSLRILSVLLIAIGLLSGPGGRTADAAITTDWSRIYGTASSGTSFGTVAIDSSGNSYVVGSFGGATLTFGGTTLTRIGTTDGFVVKLDSSGTVLWAKNYGGAGARTHIAWAAVDGSGNVHLTGTVSAASLTTPALTLAGTQDVFALKLDNAGTTTWSRIYGEASASLQAGAVAVDGSGNVYLSGTFSGATLTTPSLTLIGSQDAFLLKLDSSGTVTWARNYGGAGGVLSSNRVSTDGSGNVYLTGTFNDASMTTPAVTLIGTIDVYMLKIDSSGTTNLARGIGGTSGRLISGTIAVDSSQNIHVVGVFDADLTSPALAKIGGSDIFLIKYDTSGTVVLTKNFGGTGALSDYPRVGLDSSGNIYVGGAFNADLTTPALTKIGAGDAFVVKMTSAGSITDAQNYGGASADMRRHGTALAVDSNGVIIVGGATDNSLTTPALTKTGNVDVFIIRAGGPTETLTVTRSGAGSGTVTSSPSGISCGSTCSASFAQGASVTLTAAAASGSTFSGWSGNCSGTSTAASVTMSAARSCTATFAQTVTSGSGPTPTWLGSSGSGQLSFSSVEVTLDSSGNLSATIPAGNFNAADLTFSATLADGSSLPSWLIFDPVTLTFSGTPAASLLAAAGRLARAADTQNADGRWLATPPTKVATRLSITLQVRDRSGQTATVTFPLVVYAQRTATAVVAASVTDAGVSGNGAAAGPALSDDGAAVVFQTAATNLFGADTNTAPDIVRYDVASGRLARFSTGNFTGSIAGPADGWSGAAAISADASTIAFSSDATNIGLPWGNGLRQVWAADATRSRVSTVTPSPTAVSAAADGTLADGLSDNPALSEDGRYVAFESVATNLVSGASDGTRRVYRKDRTTGAILLVGTGRRAAISSDGRYVAFDDGERLYRADLTGGTTLTVTTGTVARMSRDGRYIAYQTAGRVMRADVALGTTETVAADGSSPSISGDGRFVVYVAQGQVQVRDMVAGTTALVSTTTSGSGGNAASADPTISGNGRYIAFSSLATDLVSGQSAGQLYVAGNPLVPPLASGWWWSSTEPGTGFAIETAGDRLMMGAFLYTAEGAPIWHLAQGTLGTTSWSGALALYQGGQTLTSAYRAPSPVGTVGNAALAISSHTAAAMSGAHSASLERYNFVSGGVAAGAQLGAPESGWWWNADEPGTGWFLEIQSSSLYLAGFLYDDSGQAIWVTSSGAMSSTRAFSGTLSCCSGGQPLGGAYRSPSCSGDLGTLTLAFSSPLAATLTLPSGRQVAIKRYRF
ncbi:MAG: hypothetical protein FJX54_05180 [Alphaproteobacteria bacterium]|nr:hypothetical protein [Alphaproteobacteria bacterium]